MPASLPHQVLVMDDVLDAMRAGLPLVCFLLLLQACVLWLCLCTMYAMCTMYIVCTVCTACACTLRVHRMHACLLLLKAFAHCMGTACALHACCRLPCCGGRCHRCHYLGS